MLVSKLRKCALVFASMVCVSRSSQAGFSCSGVLTNAQREGFQNLFTPEYSPSLRNIGGRVIPENFSKPLSAADLQRLSTSKPTVVENVKLSSRHAALLKQWLNEDASATIPGWISTTLGIIVPEAWVGLSADVFIQLVNGTGDVGRINVSNIAGQVSEGGVVGVTEQVASSSSGKKKFLWTYIYEANLNGKVVTSPLSICSADIVTK